MIAGIGFRRDAGVASVLDALHRAGAADLRRIALPRVKLDHPAARDLAAAGYDLVAVSAADMARQPTRTDSAASRKTHSTGSVAEACARAAAGPGARLRGARVISGDRMATAAVAATGEPE